MSKENIFKIEKDQIHSAEKGGNPNESTKAYRYLLDCLIDWALDVQEGLVLGKFSLKENSLVNEIASLINFDRLVDSAICHRIFAQSDAIRSYQIAQFQT